MLTSSVIDAGSSRPVDQAKQNDIGQKDIFLKLLVAQMENQDPLKPQDATQMSSQLAQFNMVEQQTKSNKLLEQLVAAGGGSTSSGIQPSNGASYLGHAVTVEQNEINFDGTDQSFSAVLDQPARDTLVFIFDATGNPVRTMSFNNLSAGANPIVWDGLMDNGAKAPQGNYTIGISPTNINGAEVGSVIQRSGQVDAVRFTPTGTQLMVGGVATSIENIIEIRL
ncbi:MAG: flagellar hook capping protein [Mariprofundus sp.]|nr:flagellar hook capping protein [Mariprofundus sp.]